MKRVASKTEVGRVISEVFSILNESFKNLVILKRTHSEDKTKTFMDETGLDHKMICEEILSLNSLNYSYTDKDKDPKRKGEIWIFGKVFNPPLNDLSTEVYIKIKLQGGRVVCLSFHPSEYAINYPI